MGRMNLLKQLAEQQFTRTEKHLHWLLARKCCQKGLQNIKFGSQNSDLSPSCRKMPLCFWSWWRQRILPVNHTINFITKFWCFIEFLHPWPRWRCHCPCSNNNKKSFNFSSSFLPIILRNRTKPILHKGYKKKNNCHKIIIQVWILKQSHNSHQQTRVTPNC